MTGRPASSSATTCCASPTPPTTWRHSHATSDTTARHSYGTRRSAATCARRLDALYFHLYGLDKDDAAYVLDTFPIVRRHDETQFGRYRTRDLVLAYIDALSAGDTLSDMAV